MVDARAVRSPKVVEVELSQLSGRVERIALRDVPLLSALDALLRPLGLDYAIRPGFIWVSSPRLLKAERMKARLGTLDSARKYVLAAPEFIARKTYGNGGAGRTRQFQAGADGNGGAGATGRPANAKCRRDARWKPGTRSVERGCRPGPGRVHTDTVFLVGNDRGRHRADFRGPQAAGKPRVRVNPSP